MTSCSNRSSSKLTAVVLIVLTCALAGCGRKAGLDLPPDATATQKSAADADVANQPAPQNLQSDIYRPPGASTVSVAPRGQKKRIPLDAILD